MSQILVSILSFVFALGVIIFIHELGHLVVAKLFDTRVKTFSLGFGKRIWGFERGETDYRVSLIPLGGYVALGGENPEDATGDPREFMSKPRWQRILIYLAGPVMNIVLAVALIAVSLMIGVNLPNLGAIEPVVGQVEEGSSAAAAGIEPGDRIVAVAGDPVESWQDIHFTLVTSPEKPVELTVESDGARRTATVTPGMVGKYGHGDSAGLIPEILPEVLNVLVDTPAAEAGFQPGDEVRSVDGELTVRLEDFIRLVSDRGGEEVTVEVLRDGQPVELRVTPEGPPGEGKIGVNIGYPTIFQRYGPVEAVRESVQQNIDIVVQTFALLGKIATGEASARNNLGGPIEIAAQSGEAARRGVSFLFYFMGFISISIAILNLLPIPILDGGQIVILTVEVVIRRDLPLRVKEVVTQVGFVLILLLMLTVIWFDISRNFFGG